MAAARLRYHLVRPSHAYPTDRIALHGFIAIGILRLYQMALLTVGWLLYR